MAVDCAESLLNAKPYEEGDDEVAAARGLEGVWLVEGVECVADGGCDFRRNLGDGSADGSGIALGHDLLRGILVPGLSSPVEGARV